LKNKINIYCLFSAVYHRLDLKKIESELFIKKYEKACQQESTQARTLPPGSPSPPKGATVVSPGLRSAPQTPHVIGARCRSTT
jgi:hypothetical protein